jgi:hypothetical protein
MEGGQEWPGASSRWHIQSHRRLGIGPDGPANWEKRGTSLAEFMNTIPGSKPEGRRHMYDPPSSIVPRADRETVWRSTIRYLQPSSGGPDRPTGTRRVSHAAPVEGMGWTGKHDNFTGPKHYAARTTTVQPDALSPSYFVEQSMGMKKLVLSSAMGLAGVYDDAERRCLRPAAEWSLDTLMQRKIRVDSRKTGAPPSRCASACVLRGMASLCCA